MTKKRRYIPVTFLTLVGIYLLQWYFWSHGIVILKSTQEGGGTIILRKLSISSSVWALPVSLLVEEKRCYRCEYYWPVSGRLHSAHTFFDYDNGAVKPMIIWHESGGATVSLGGEGLTMDKFHYWRRRQ
jgi:hypothetical protein